MSRPRFHIGTDAASVASRAAAGAWTAEIRIGIASELPPATRKRLFSKLEGLSDVFIGINDLKPLQQCVASC